MKNKITKLINQYKDLINENETLLPIYEELDNREMINYTKTQNETLKDVIKDLKGLL